MGCALLAAWALTGRDRAVTAASGAAGSTRLELGVDSCNESPSVTVEESSTEVRVRVTSGRWLGRNSDDCADFAVVILQSPLANRRVVDASNGAVVMVKPPEPDLPPR